MVPSNLDHFHLAVSDLEQGMDWVEEKLGVRPVLGGKHPRYGTHNALLSLGEKRYLEVIAPDPELPAPPKGRLFDPPAGKIRPAFWVLRVDDIEAVTLRAQRHGLKLGEIEAGERTRPDGTIVRWTLTDPYVRPCDGAVPFLISWGDTPHPASSAPLGGALVGFQIETPIPAEVTNALLSLGTQTDVIKGKALRFVVSIETERGIVQIG